MNTAQPMEVLMARAIKRLVRPRPRALPTHPELRRLAIRRAIRRTLISDPHRVWTRDAIVDAIDPTGINNRRALLALLGKHTASVARSIGMAVFKDGTRSIFTSPETAERDFPHRVAERYEAIVEKLLRENPRHWTMHEIKARIYPQDDPARLHQRTHIHAVVDRVRLRFGWAKVRDPLNPRRMIFAPAT